MAAARAVAEDLERLQLAPPGPRRPVIVATGIGSHALSRRIPRRRLSLARSATRARRTRHGPGFQPSSLHRRARPDRGRRVGPRRADAAGAASARRCWPCARADLAPATCRPHSSSTSTRASRLGAGAVSKHLDYFRTTGMDFVKVQYERTFPRLPQIESPADWKSVPRYGLDFYRPQLEVVEALVKAAGREALVLVTLYSTFMCAGHSASRALLVKHLEQDGEAVRPALDTIAESLLGFVRECRNLGVDGFYASTQGGEAGTLPRSGLVREVRDAFRPAADARGRLLVRLQHPARLRLRRAVRRPGAVHELPGPRGQLQPAPQRRRA